MVFDRISKEKEQEEEKLKKKLLNSLKFQGGKVHMNDYFYW